MASMDIIRREVRVAAKPLGQAQCPAEQHDTIGPDLGAQNAEVNPTRLVSRPADLTAQTNAGIGLIHISATVPE